MEARKLFSISFFINFIFMMLTTILSLIVFNINQSTSDINVIMAVFASSLLITRVFSMTNLLKFRAEIIFGSFSFVLGCLMLVINSGSMIFLFTGATLFGMSVGLVPPAILVALSDNKEKRDSNLAIYNAIVALASVFSPIIGESIYTINSSLLFTSWLLLALVMAILALFLKKGISNEASSSSNTRFYNLKKVFSNKLFRIAFIVLLFSSISYGSVVSYLPVYFESIGLSIGVYYLFFWTGYILAQFLKNITYRFKVVLLALFFVLLGQASLAIFNLPLLLYISAFIYGLGYGSLFKVFYVGIGNFKNEAERSIGFSTIGLISYIGVGIAPIFLIPFNKNWTLLFTGNIIYSAIALAMFLYLWRKYGQE